MIHDAVAQAEVFVFDEAIQLDVFPRRNVEAVRVFEREQIGDACCCG